MFGKKPKLSPEMVTIDATSQYSPIHPTSGQVDASSFNPTARANLYRYSRDGRDLGLDEIDVLKPFFADGPKSVLEVGFGDGSFSVLLEHSTGNKGRMVGIDINQGIVNAAQILYNNRTRVEFMQGDVYALPFEPNEFDIVVANAVIYHTPLPVEALVKLAAVTKELLVVSSRDVSNQAKVWKHAGVAAANLGVTISPTPYSNCDIGETRSIMRALRYENGQPALKVLRGNKKTKQDSILEIPLYSPPAPRKTVHDLAVEIAPGSPRATLDTENEEAGWLDWRLAQHTMRPYMHDEEGMMPDAGKFKDFVDADIKDLFLREYHRRLESEGRGYVRDRVCQAFMVGVKQEKKSRLRDKTRAFIGQSISKTSS